MNWDDLRFFLAVVRSGGTGKAASDLGVNQSTVSRRIVALEETVGAPLFARVARGLAPNPLGMKLLPHAETAERAVVDFRSELVTDRTVGMVRVATLSELGTWFIAPKMAAFNTRFPDIEIKLMPETLDPERDEVDIALCFSAPARGTLLGRKLRVFTYRAYAATSYLALLDENRRNRPERWEWLGLAPSSGDVPEQTWFREHLLRVNPVMYATNLDILAKAVIAGMGVALLPCPVAEFYAELEPLDLDTSGLTRELWIMTSRQLFEMPRIRAVWDFLATSFD